VIEAAAEFSISFAELAAHAQEIDGRYGTFMILYGVDASSSFCATTRSR